MSNLPPKLEEIVADFGFIEGREKLEYLLEFSESLPPLPERLQGKRDEMDEVHECMTPVFIFPEFENGGVIYHFDIPPESPTVRGFASILKQGLDGLEPAGIVSIPDDFYRAMGLHKVLTGQRLNGIGAILAHMKQLALRY